MSGALGELGAYFRNQVPLTAADMVRLAAAGRASGLGWDAIARACDPGAPGAADSEDDRDALAAAAWRVFRDIQHAAGADGGDRHRLAALSWPCRDCGRLVTDAAPCGRPAHVEIGHGPACARLARDQARDDRDRRTRLPRLVAASEPASGPLQRHRLARRITDWCPRCGWYGYFDGWAATIRANWARLVCDNCWADLHPAVTVTVTYFTCTARPDGREAGGGPFAVLRQRARSDTGSADAGQALTWEPFWRWTPLLAGRSGDGPGPAISPAGRETAEEAGWALIRRRWPDAALRLPWIASAYPGESPG